MDQILAAVDTYGDDLTNAQLRQLCGNFDASTWAKALLVVFQNASPRIVTAKGFMMLLSASSKLKEDSSSSEVAMKFAPEIDQLKISGREALGEIAALIRDSSSDPTANALSLGPHFLLESVQPGPEVNAASRIMYFFVVHAEAIFGKAATRSNYDALGARPRTTEDAFDAESQFSARSNRSGRPPRDTPRMADALAEAGFM